MEALVNWPCLAVQAGGDPATEVREAVSAPDRRNLAERYLREYVAKRSMSTRHAAETLFRALLDPVSGFKEALSGEPPALTGFEGVDSGG